MREVPDTRSNLPRPGGPYSQIVRIGNIAASAGQAGFDLDGNLVSDDITGQTRLALENLASAFHAAGLTLDDVIRVGVFLTSVDDFAPMNDVYETFFSEPRPARTTVFVTLPGDMRIELDAWAVESRES